MTSTVTGSAVSGGALRARTWRAEALLRALEKVLDVLAIELLLAGDVAVDAGRPLPLDPGGGAAGGRHPAARLVADAVADSASSAATDEVVERLRRLLVGTCLARHCLGDIIVGIDTEERAARSAS